MGKQLIRYESGQTAKAFEELTDSGDNKTFEASFNPVSDATGFAPTIAPYGLATGGAIVPGSSNDEVDIAALTLIAPGMTGADADGVVTVSAGTLTALRGVTSDTNRITALTVASNGTLTAVAGIDHTAFSEVRGDPGGPPYIPVGSVLIGEVRLTSVTAGLVVASEIFNVPGTHLELADQPGYDLNYATGELTFDEALPLIHTGDLPKKVYLKGATPIFAKLQSADAWKAAKPSTSLSSIDSYDGPKGSRSTSLTAASFTSIVKDGITENIMNQIGENVWVEYRPDEDNLVPKQLTQGVLDVSVSNPATGRKIATFTLAAESATVDIKA